MRTTDGDGRGDRKDRLAVLVGAAHRQLRPNLHKLAYKKQRKDLPDRPPSGQKYVCEVEGLRKPLIAGLTLDAVDTTRVTPTCVPTVRGWWLNKG